MRYAVAMTKDRRDGAAVRIREDAFEARPGMLAKQAEAIATGLLFKATGRIEPVEIAIVCATSCATARACALGV